jgi:hypothetical protein
MGGPQTHPDRVEINDSMKFIDACLVAWFVGRERACHVVSKRWE